MRFASALLLLPLTQGAWEEPAVTADANASAPAPVAADSAVADLSVTMDADGTWQIPPSFAYAGAECGGEDSAALFASELFRMTADVADVSDASGMVAQCMSKCLNEVQKDDQSPCTGVFVDTSGKCYLQYMQISEGTENTAVAEPYGCYKRNEIPSYEL